MGNRKGRKLSESCVKANLKMKGWNNGKDAKTRQNKAMSCVEIDLRKMLSKIVEIWKFNNYNVYPLLLL